MRNIMVSSSEAEYGTIFIKSQTAVPIRITLIEMSWKLGPTSNKVEIFTALGIAKRSFAKRNQKQWI